MKQADTVELSPKHRGQVTVLWTRGGGGEEVPMGTLGNGRTLDLSQGGTCKDVQVAGHGCERTAEPRKTRVFPREPTGGQGKRKQRRRACRGGRPRGVSWLLAPVCFIVLTASRPA